MVTEWLLKNGAPVNALDRWNRTPLNDAWLAKHDQVATLLKTAGGKVYENGKVLCNLYKLSHLQTGARRGRRYVAVLKSYRVNVRQIAMLPVCMHDAPLRQLEMSELWQWGFDPA